MFYSLESLRQLSQLEGVRVERPWIHRTGLHRNNRFAHRCDIHFRIAFVRVDDVEAAPVPELHVDLSRTILVITRDHESPTLTRKLACQIQRLLFAGRFDYAFTTASLR